MSIGSSETEEVGQVEGEWQVWGGPWLRGPPLTAAPHCSLQKTFRSTVPADASCSQGHTHTHTPLGPRAAHVLEAPQLPVTGRDGHFAGVPNHALSIASEVGMGPICQRRKLRLREAEGHAQNCRAVDLFPGASGTDNRQLRGFKQWKFLLFSAVEAGSPKSRW